MELLTAGHTAVNVSGCVVEVDGKPICNTSTMVVLESHGLIRRVSRRTWMAANIQPPKLAVDPTEVATDP